MLSRDEDFLSAMAASPHDWSVRLAHADWLEERGDPRADLVRLTYEVLHGLWGEPVRHGRLAELYRARLILPTPQMELGRGPTLRLIPPGSFVMGSPAGEEDRYDRQAHVAVTLSRSFWLGRYAVTQHQWWEVMETQPWRGEAFAQEGDDYPATYVSWEEAQEFCRRLTSREQGQSALAASLEYRLPTEAQWEYACRAGTTSAYSFGDDASALDRYAWYGENADRIGEQYPHRVGQKLPNPWGLCDMHGNVWESCQVEYAESLPGGDDPPVSSGGSFRMRRGGSWASTARHCRSASRRRNELSEGYGYLGFRVAAVPLSE